MVVVFNSKLDGDTSMDLPIHLDYDIKRKKMNKTYTKRKRNIFFYICDSITTIFSLYIFLIIFFYNYIR